MRSATKKGAVMIRLFVDSGSSIKQSEKEKLNVEILPLRILLGDKEYLDDIDLDIDTFYDLLVNKKLFPKTSLPPLDEADEKIENYTAQGDEVIIITISSGISGTYDTIKAHYSQNPRVHVVDSKSAVGGIRILVNEVNKHRNDDINTVLNAIYDLIPRIKIFAIPETLTYLHRGGRLSRTECIVGSILQLKPIITFREGKVRVAEKAIGLPKSKIALIRTLEKYGCDTSYPIVPAYTHETRNLDDIVNRLDPKYKGALLEYDNLDPAIACHWGPGAFGLIFVSSKI